MGEMGFAYSRNVRPVRCRNNDSNVGRCTENCLCGSPAASTSA
jgi:hypothetical protein